MIITFLLQNIAQGGYGREKMLLAIHRILLNGDFQRKTGALSKNRSHGPGGSGKGNSPIPFLTLSGKVLSLFPQGHQLGQKILRKISAVFLVHKGKLCGLHINIDKISFFLRKFQVHILRIHIMLFNKLGGLKLRA